MGAVGTVGEGLFEVGIDEGDVAGPLRRGYGGDAANTAVAAAHLGVDARLCGRTGGDALGRLLVAFWQRTGVDTRWIRVDDEAPTGIYVSLEEAGDVLGTADPDDIPRALGGGPRELVITMGAEGALVNVGGSSTRVALPVTDVVDATGAGDALAGAYLASRLQNVPPPYALARAVAAASLSCGTHGCALSYPDAARVDALLARTP